MDNKQAVSEEEIASVLEETLQYLIDTKAPTEIIENAEWALGPRNTSIEDALKWQEWKNGTPISSQSQITKLAGGG